MAIGYIPDKLIFISRAPIKVVNKFEDCDEGEEINSFEARPTFIATNQKTKETGLAWAGNSYDGEYVDGKWKPAPKKKPLVEEFDNTPFKKLRIVSYEQRREGGGAFKVIAGENYYVDLRNDTLLDILVNADIKQGEAQNCEFIWARMGSQMKVVRVGSAIHKKLIESDKKKAMPPIKKSELKIGDILEDSGGAHRVFLGYANTLDFDFERTRGGYPGYSYEYTLKGIKLKKNVLVFSSEKDGSIKNCYNVTILANVPKSYLFGHIEVKSGWINKIKEIVVDNASKYAHIIIDRADNLCLSECGVIPELYPLLEKYRKEYEEFKKGAKL